MNNISNFSLSDIVNNLGITYIYKLRRGVINKNPQDYYEVMWADIGFITEDNIFISLMNNVGEMYQMEICFDDEEFAIDFRSFKELSNEYIGYEPELFLEKYKDKAGKFYTWNFEKKAFEEITDEAFLAKQKKEAKSNLDILKMYDSVKETIISQDEQVKQVLASVYKNQKIINSSLDDETISKLKENIIVYGPTGTGKTEILSQIAKLCNVPIVIEDITSFSETGYVGRDISEMLTDLYNAAGMDIEFAQRGILVIDEFDKLAECGLSGNGAGPSRNGVQRSLLKLLDGGVIGFREDYSDGDLIDFNTSKLTVVALGAFSEIKKNDDYTDVSTKDFIDYGIMREVMGRFSKLVQMNAFKREDYRKILLESKLSPINTYTKLFDEMGIKFSYDDNLIDYIIDEAIALDCGARSLKTVFDGIISDYLFDVFAKDKKEIHISIPKGKSYVTKKRASENRRAIGFR